MTTTGKFSKTDPAGRTPRISLATDAARCAAEDPAGPRAERSLRHNVSAVHASVAVPDGQTQRAIDLLSDERFVKLDANLRYFDEKYASILSSHDERRDMLASVRGTPYRRVERLYYEYIRSQRAEVELMLGRLSGLEDNADRPKSQ